MTDLDKCGPMNDKPAGLQQLLSAVRRYRNIETEFGIFRLQSLTEKERSDFEGWLLKGGERADLSRLRDARRKLVSLCLVDENGARIVPEGEEDQLGAVDGALMTTLFEAAQDLVGLTKSDIDAAKKNSKAVHAG